MDNDEKLSYNVHQYTSVIVTKYFLFLYQSEYAAAFADSQAMGVQNRAHIEELQRYCRERDDLVNDLEAKVRSQEDAMKIYKKVK